MSKFRMLSSLSIEEDYWSDKMIDKYKAWYELIKLGNIGSLRKDINDFFKGNILNIMGEEGVFDYLVEEREFEEISKQFNYTDTEFLNELLSVLVNDGVIAMKNNRYIVDTIEHERKLPSIFTEAVIDIWNIHAQFIPNRLRGDFMEFTGGFNLFNWDDALTNRMYGQIRKSAFAYSGVLKKSGKFLDVGCGTGYGTAAIWSYYYENGKINDNGSCIEIIGIDNDKQLLNIAIDEFSSMVKKQLKDKPTENILNNCVPEFLEGNAEQIPFDDNTFDFVYASQVLHWTDAKQAMTEMMRVTKPGGIIFGTQNLYPNANPYNELHFKTVRGAGGFFSKNDMYRWAKEIGVKKIKNATPITVFKIIK